MNNIKMVVTDLDGTLLNNNHNISDYSKEVLQSLEKNGIEIVIATGRHFWGMKHYKDFLENNNDSIVFNGAVVANNDGNFLYYRPIDDSTSRDVIEIAKKYNVSMHFYHRDKYIALDDDDYSREYTKKVNIKNIIYGIDSLDSFEFTKMIFMGDRNLLEKLQIEIRESVKVHTCFSQTNYLEILSTNVNKFTALEYICNKKNISFENIISFGDNYNDIELLSNVGIGVAIYNACEDVKKCAKYTTSFNNDEDGVAKFLLDFFKF